MDEKVELTLEEKKIRNLKIAAATFTAIAGVCNLVKTPMKNAHKNSLKLPSNNIVNAEVEIPAKNKVLIKE